MATLTEIQTEIHNLLIAGVGSMVATYASTDPIIGLSPLPEITGVSLPAVSYRISTVDQPFGITDSRWIVNCYAETTFASMELGQAVSNIFRDAMHGDNIGFNTEANILSQIPEPGATNTPVSVRAIAI